MRLKEVTFLSFVPALAVGSSGNSGKRADNFEHNTKQEKQRRSVLHGN
jgi:hypothetical protein